jgi:hypothetical protein
MFFFLLFSNPFTKGKRKIRNPTWGDEFMFGNWSITEIDISENQTIGQYNLFLVPHSSQDALIGNLTSIYDGNKEVKELILRFHGFEDRDSFLVKEVIEGYEKALFNVNFTFYDNNLLSAYGVYDNIIYSANMFSDKSMEITTYNELTGAFLLYRMSKPDIHPQQSILKKAFYTVSFIVYMYTRMKDNGSAKNEVGTKPKGPGKKKKN